MGSHHCLRLGSPSSRCDRSSAEECGRQPAIGCEMTHTDLRPDRGTPRLQESAANVVEELGNFVVVDEPCESDRSLS